MEEKYGELEEGANRWIIVTGLRFTLALKELDGLLEWLPRRVLVGRARAFTVGSNGPVIVIAISAVVLIVIIIRVFLNFFKPWRTVIPILHVRVGECERSVRASSPC